MFHWIEFRAFCHATEEEERVATALRTVAADAELRREALEGHFGNPLVVLTARVDGASAVRAAWRRIATALGPDEVLRDLSNRIDEDLVYHLRLDKQKAYLGAIELPGSADVIAMRGKVAAFPKRREVAERVMRDSVEGA